MSDPTAARFFTLRLADPHSDLLLREVDSLRRAMRAARARHGLVIDAIAVLPAVLHCLWHLPQGCRHASAIGTVKSRFAQDRRLWLRDSWSHRVAGPEDLQQHRDRIHLSPVLAGLCAHPQDWPHSSIHRALRDGLPVPDTAETRMVRSVPAL